MSKHVTETATIYRVERLKNSTNGNPRYRLYTSEGEFTTQPDGSIPYEIDNWELAGYIGNNAPQVTLYMTPKRRWVWLIESR